MFPALYQPCTTLYHQFGASRTTNGLICPIYGILRLFFGHYGAPWWQFGTCMQNWDFFGTKFGLWSHLGPSPKFGTSLKRLGQRHPHVCGCEDGWTAGAPPRPEHVPCGAQHALQTKPDSVLIYVMCHSFPDPFCILVKYTGCFFSLVPPLKVLSVSR